jgi:hypothetical protein
MSGQVSTLDRRGIALLGYGTPPPDSSGFTQTEQASNWVSLPLVDHQNPVPAMIDPLR